MAASPEAGMVGGPVAAAAEATEPDDLRTSFIDAMGRTATGVTVVGTDGPAGRLAQTVSAMCSVSADPETLLVCVHRKSPLNEAIARHGVFAVSVLGVQHDHVATRSPAGPGRVRNAGISPAASGSVCPPGPRRLKTPWPTSTAACAKSWNADRTSFTSVTCSMSVEKPASR